MKKSDFFDENIVAFADKGHLHHHDVVVLSASQRIVYYEWNKSLTRWMKLRTEDPDPDPTLPNGSFDGQIIEVEL